MPVVLTEWRDKLKLDTLICIGTINGERSSCLKDFKMVGVDGRQISFGEG
jgi:hypothetical protein